jgi:myo-inositol-1(or 4)-monophosphatase
MYEGRAEQASSPEGAIDDLREVSEAARDLAERAGKTLLASLEIRDLQVHFKGHDFADPVSAVDKAIEDDLRVEITRRFPDHSIVGEERGGAPIGGEGFVWAIDPIDGTTNFIRRYPLFASSIGVLRNGVPVAGAVWCSVTPLCRPGIYHVRDGRVFLDDLPAEAWNRGSERPLVGDVGPPRHREKPYDRRASGSAAVECAYVAAGVLDAARFRKLWIWDVAAGLALVRAAKIPIWTEVEGGGWVPFERFEPPARPRSGREPTIADWHRPLLLGALDAAGE